MNGRFACLLLLSGVVVAGACQLARRVEMPEAPRGPAYLAMGADENQPLPATLSATGAFTDVRTLTPSPSLIPYELNVPFYSDGAMKRRWFSLPRSDGSGGGPAVGFAPGGPWAFPNGTVFVKHFEFAGREGQPPQRVETRVLVRDNRGFVYGASYRWRPDGSDADLVTTSHTETLRIAGAKGVREQRYFLPAAKDCRACHTPASGGVLGVNTRQLNRDVLVAGRKMNQLQHFSAMGMFGAPPGDVAGLPRLPLLEDQHAPLELRVRAYLDANCAQCHQPGAVPDFDARFDRTNDLAHALTIRVRLAMGIDHAKIVAPDDPWRSMLLVRTDSLETTKMPPLGRETIDAAGVALLRQWVMSLPGMPVLAPPVMEPAGGDFDHPVRVTIKDADAAAVLHFTLDGSAPTEASRIYREPLEITSPTVVRAVAYRAGAVQSVPTQQVYSVGE